VGKREPGAWYLPGALLNAVQKDLEGADSAFAKAQEPRAPVQGGESSLWRRSLWVPVSVEHYRVARGGTTDSAHASFGPQPRSTSEPARPSLYIGAVLSGAGQFRFGGEVSNWPFRTRTTQVRQGEARRQV